MNPLNQCDGCRRGLPLRDGCHYNPDGSYDYIGCTANLYLDTTGGLDEKFARELDAQLEVHAIKKSPLTEKVLDDIAKAAEAGGPVIVIDSLSATLGEASTCSCDQRGRNVSCARCKP